MFCKTIAVSRAPWKIWVGFIDFETGRKPLDLEEALQKAHLNTASYRKRQRPVNVTDWVRTTNYLAEALPAAREKFKLLARGTAEYRSARETLLFIKSTLDEAEEGLGKLLAFLPDDRGLIARAQALIRTLSAESAEPPVAATMQEAQEVVVALGMLDDELGNIVEPHVSSRFPPPWLPFVQHFPVRELSKLRSRLDDCRLKAARQQDEIAGRRRQEEYRGSIAAALEGYEMLELRVDNHFSHDVIISRSTALPLKDGSSFTLTIYPHPGKFNRALLAMLEVLESELNEGHDTFLRVPKKTPYIERSVFESEARSFSLIMQATDEHVVSLVRKIGAVLERDKIDPHLKMLSLHRKPNCHPALAIESPADLPTGGIDAFAKAVEMEKAKVEGVRYEKEVRAIVGDGPYFQFRPAGDSPTHYLVAHADVDVSPPKFPSHSLTVYPHPDNFNTSLTLLLELLARNQTKGHFFSLRVPKQSPNISDVLLDGTAGPFGLIVEATENEVAWLAHEMSSMLANANIRPHEKMPTDARIPHHHEALAHTHPGMADGQTGRPYFDPFIDTNLTMVTRRSHEGRWTFFGGKLGIASSSLAREGKKKYEPRDTVGVLSTNEILTVTLASGFGPLRVAAPMARLVGETLIQKTHRPVDNLHNDVFFEEVRRGLLRNVKVAKTEDPGVVYARVKGFWNGGLQIEHSGNIRIVFRPDGAEGFHILALDQSNVPNWILEREMDDAGFHPPLSGPEARRYYEDMRMGDRATATGASLTTTEEGVPWDVTGGIHCRSREAKTHPRITTLPAQLGRPWSAPGSLCIIMTPDIWRAVPWSELVALAGRDVSPTDLARTLVDKAEIGTAIVFRF